MVTMWVLEPYTETLKAQIPHNMKDTVLIHLGNQLWAMFVPFRCAFLEGYRNIILETDNVEAYHIIKKIRISMLL